MAFTKYASLDAATVLDVKGTPTRQRTASLDKVADYHNYRTGDGYMYVRMRAISSRVNKNNDGWPTVELAGSPELFERHQSSDGGGFTIEASEGGEYGFATFMGKPHFVDHHNSDPKRARGVVVDAKFHMLGNSREAALDEYYSSDEVDAEHLPPCEVELLIEVDAKSFPKLAQAIQNGDIDGFSMGCDVEKSKCSHCGNEATSPDEYCSHIVMKGAQMKVESGKHKGKSRKSYENCYGIKFFEISAVFDPADETALTKEVRSSVTNEGMDKESEYQYVVKRGDKWVILQKGTGKVLSTHASQEEAEAAFRAMMANKHGNIHVAENPLPQSDHTTAPAEVDTLRQEQVCPVCFAPGTLVRTADGLVPIETVEIGDRVLTESGLFKPVKRLVETEFNGLLHAIDVKAASEPILATDNHPFKTLLATTHDRCMPARCSKAKSFTDTHRLGWAHAGHLTKDHYLVVNTPKEFHDLESIEIPAEFFGARRQGNGARRGPTAIPLTPEFLWAVGLYLAEGNSGSREITYSSHRNEVEYQQRIQDLFGSLGYGTRLDIRDSRPNSAWVHIHSSVLAEWFPRWLGEGCANKRIPAELINLPDDKVAHILRGILDGDGCEAFDTLHQTSSMLASQVVELSHRLMPAGNTATISRENTDGKKRAYNVQGASGSAIRLLEAPRRTLAYGKGKWEFEGYHLNRIRSVSQVPYWGSVYNLEIEDDPTYTVQNILVHNCGSDMDKETCDVCGFVEPPKHFDNPNLEKAKLRDEALEMGGGQTTVPEDADAENGAPAQGATQPGSFLQAEKAKKSGPPAGVMSSMRWEPKLNPKVAGKINQIERPVRPVSRPVTDEPNETVTSDPGHPVTSAFRTAQDMIQAAKRNQGEQMSTRVADAASGAPAVATPDKRVDVTGVGGVMEDSNDAASHADAQVNVMGTGGTGVEGVEADEHMTLPTASPDSNDSGFNHDKTTDDSGHTKTWGDGKGKFKQKSPVTTEHPYWVNENKWSSLSPEQRTAITLIAGDDKVWPPDEISGGSANQGVQPVDPVGKADKRVDVLEHVTSPANNSGPTKQWTGTGGNGVTRQQDPVTGDVIKSNGLPVGGQSMISAHMVTAMKLADTEIELGMLDKEYKYARIAELENWDTNVLRASLTAYTKVKTAGLNKTAAKSPMRLPSFKRATAAVDTQAPEPVDESDLDSALFSR